MLAKFIPLREAAEIIGVSPKTLENWLAGGYFARTADGKNVNFQRFPTLDAKKLVNAPKMSAHHRGICHF